MNKLFGSCLVLMMLVLTSGCATTPAPYRHYVLQPLAAEAEHPVVTSLGVAPIKVPEWMDRNYLIYSDGNFRLEQMPLDRWGEPLEEAVTRIVTQNLRRQNPEAVVRQGPWLTSERPDTVIELEVLNFILAENELMLEVSWSLAGKTGQPHTGTSLSRIYLTEFVAAIDLVRAFSQLLGDLTMDLQKQINTGQMY